MRKGIAQMHASEIAAYDYLAQELESQKNLVKELENKAKLKK